jgi:hypothetical protein
MELTKWLLRMLSLGILPKTMHSGDKTIGSTCCPNMTLATTTLCKLLLYASFPSTVKIGEIIAQRNDRFVVTIR